MRQLRQTIAACERTQSQAEHDGHEADDCSEGSRPPAARRAGFTLRVFGVHSSGLRNDSCDASRRGRDQS